MHETNETRCIYRFFYTVYYQLHTYIIDQDQKTKKGNFNFQLRTLESNMAIASDSFSERSTPNSGYFKLVMAAELGLNSTAKLKSAS